MKTTAVSMQDLAGSVFAVPPLARRADLSLDPVQQQRLSRHIEAGGVTTLLYGGNANVYHMGLREYPHFLDVIEDCAAPDTWVIPSAGPDFGKLMDQAEHLRGRRFPAVMVLPMAFPSMPGGTAKALRAFADAIGKPLILYLKAETQLHLRDVVSLVEDQLVCGIKYAIPRADPASDPWLDELLKQLDRRWVACGLAERAALSHLTKHRLASYTSGGVCMAPRLSAAFMAAAKRGDHLQAAKLREAFLPLEHLRERSQVFAALHEAISRSGVADMGVCLPMLERIDDGSCEELIEIVRALMSAEADLQPPDA